jgi:anti-sigma B factor antagonist
VLDWKRAATEILKSVNVSGGEVSYLFELMQPFKLEVEKLPTSTDAQSQYAAKGKLSLETVNEFIQKLRPDPAQHVVLDMSGVTFLDSAGVGSLVSLFVSRRNQSKTFALAGLTAQGKAVVTVAGLQNLLPIYNTLAEATSAAAAAKKA